MHILIASIYQLFGDFSDFWMIFRFFSYISQLRLIPFTFSWRIQVDTSSVIQRRPKLTLTRPKDPKLETAHRVRAVRIKSSAELEAEMLAKIPKFKARPLNKKVSFPSKTFIVALDKIYS